MLRNYNDPLYLWTKINFRISRWQRKKNHSKHKKHGEHTVHVYWYIPDKYKLYIPDKYKLNIPILKYA